MASENGNDGSERGCSREEGYNVVVGLSTVVAEIGWVSGGKKVAVVASCRQWVAAPLLGFPALVNRKEGRSGDGGWLSEFLGNSSVVGASHGPRGKMEAGDVYSNNGGSRQWWPTVVVWVARK
ncbi:unnamed protein product [Lactuca saligna]|uniref:Uncharacterized protein n=1 Tax=Lactuca saligna TaxID=75948 RepID=A0AA35UNP6_LACSI|nr:unnamed protein product [Lactuca saligna]